MASSSPNHAAIQEAIHVVDGDFENIAYRVARADYPDQWIHEIDISDVPNDSQHAASIAVIEELAKRGFIVRSVQFDACRLHVERAEWVVEDG